MCAPNPFAKRFNVPLNTHILIAVYLYVESHNGKPLFWATKRAKQKREVNNTQKASNFCLFANWPHDIYTGTQKKSDSMSNKSLCDVMLLCYSRSTVDFQLIKNKNERS